MNTLLYSVEQLHNIKQSYIDELTKAAQDQTSSVSFILNELPQAALVKEGELFQVMVIGGSVFETALVKKEHGHLSIHAPRKASQPVFRTRQDLMDLITTYLDPTVSVLALNFAYPLLAIVRDDVLDGVLVRATKEHIFDGLVGEKVGASIEDDQKHRHGRTLRVICTNDTVCLVLSGLTKGIAAEKLGAGIIGTGYNMGFFSADRVVANTESGNFDKFPASESGAFVDSRSENKGAQRFEKEVAGGYLYQHFNYYAKQLNEALLDSSEELSVIVQNDDASGTLAKHLFERAASLAACQIAGASAYLKQKEMTWVMEGSMFWKGWQYRENVEKYLELLGVPKGAITFVEVPNSSLLGAAQLVI